MGTIELTYSLILSGEMCWLVKHQSVLMQTDLFSCDSRLEQSAKKIKYIYINNLFKLYYIIIILKF